MYLWSQYMIPALFLVILTFIGIGIPFVFGGAYDFDVTTQVGNTSFSYAGENNRPGVGGLQFPNGVWLDNNRNLVFCESSGNRIRQIVNSKRASVILGKTVSYRILLTIGGNGTAGFNGNGRVAVSTLFKQPQSIWGDSIGSFFYS